MDKRKTVLIIDDIADFSRMLARQLEYWGYRVLKAASGERGLVVAEAEKPDLILLDILMPKMKGREVCAHLKANPKTHPIPVIFLTALGMADHIRAGLALGAEDYIIKPFRPADLKERIEVCLSRRGNS